MQRYWLTCFILSLLVITLGASTRLYDAGISCPDWPLCYGKAKIVLDEKVVEEINALNPDAQYDIFRVSLEVAHRYLATLLGLLALGLVCRNAVKRQKKKLIPILFLVIVTVQGIFGMLTVTLKLEPWIVVTHLLLGFSTVCFCFWLYLSAVTKNIHKSQKHIPDNTRYLLYMSLIAIFIQIALGGWTGSSGAALACLDYPTCGGLLIPELSLSQQSDSYLQTIQFIHRWFALIVTILLAITIYQVLLTNKNNQAVHSKAPYLLLFLLILQWSLGISNILLLRPVVIALSHNLGGLSILLTLLYIMRLTTSSKQNQ